MTRRQFLKQYRLLFAGIPDDWLEAEAPDKAVPFVLIGDKNQPLLGIVADVRLSLNAQSFARPARPAVELGYGFYAQPLSEREDAAHSILLHATAAGAMECCHMADGRRRLVRTDAY